jgi:hypothetical protein
MRTQSFYGEGVESIFFKVERQVTNWATGYTTHVVVLFISKRFVGDSTLDIEHGCQPITVRVLDKLR